MRLDGIAMLKGGTTVTGAAYVGWNGTYSFNVDGRGIAVETLALAAMKTGPGFTGLVDFTATGSGTFDLPRYDVKFGVRDLFVGDEGVGEVTGRLSVRDTVLIYELEAASTRLAVSGTGPHRAHRRDGRGALVPRHRHVARPVRPRVPAAALAVHLRRGERHRSASSASSYNPDALRVDVDVDDVQPAAVRLRAAQRRAASA